MKKFYSSIIIPFAVMMLQLEVLAQDEQHLDPEPGAAFELVSDLVALPAFISGMGTLYVDPSTLPAGPFLAYDRDKHLVSTIYMIPLDSLNAQKAFEGLGASGQKVVQTDVIYNAGHPGVEVPHYHIVLWHVAPDSASLD